MDRTRRHTYLLITVSGLALALGQAAMAQTVSAPTGGATTDAIGEVVVTASRIANSGFTAPTPTTVIGAEQLQARAAVNVADVLNEIPAFRPTTTPQGTSIGGGFGANIVDLRGIGTNRTLVLIDGRRHVPSLTNGTVDLNLIPTSLISRTEVVTGGASASWGSDAVAGVVNILLDSKLQGVRGNLSYGMSAHNDAQDYTGSLAAGTGFAGGRGHVIVGFEYDKNLGTGFYQNARDWSRDLYFTVSPNNPRAAGLPSRVIAPNVHFSNLLAYGGVIPSGPLANTTFLPGGTPTRFNVGSIVGANLMVGGDNDGLNLVTGSFLVNPVQRDVGYARLTYDVTPKINAFAELSYGHAGQDTFSANRRNQGNLTIRVDNAFLPASIRAQMQALGLTSVPFGRVDGEIGNYRQNNQRDTRRGVLGLKGEFGSGWSWDGYYQYGYNQSFSAQANNTLTSNYLAAIDAVVSPTGAIVCRGGQAGADPGCVPYNVFGAGSPSQAAIDYVTEPNFTHTFTREQVAAANLRGEPFSVWAGPVSLAAGVEWREEAANVKSDINQQRVRYDFGNTQPIKGSFTVREAYAETAVPLARDSGFIHAFDISGAVRRTDYSLAGAVTTWKFGATFEDSSRQVRLRGTRSRDIRAPNIQELFSASSSTIGNIRDPLTGGTSLTTTLTSGNLALRPEVADTFTYGGVLSPKVVPGLRLSADYYNIDISGVIATLGAQNVVDRCAAGAAELCALVTRQNGATGTILSVLNNFQNQNRLKTSGVDFEASYRAPISKVGLPGDLTVRALGTLVYHLATTDSAGTVDRARQTVPRWGWNYSFNYALERFSANLTIRTIGKRIGDTTLIGPEQAGYSPALANSINKNVFPAVMYVNLSAQYTIKRTDDRSLVLYGVVNNLTDRDPPNGAGNNAQTGTLYDLIGRYYRVGMRFSY